jgi:hypothetical protein
MKAQGQATDGKPRHKPKGKSQKGSLSPFFLFPGDVLRSQGGSGHEV